MQDNTGKYDIHELAEKWANGTISDEERDYFEKWYAGFNDEEVELTSGRHVDAEALHKVILSGIYQKIETTRRGRTRRMRSLYRITAAASIVLLLATTGYFFWQKDKSSPSISQGTMHDIAPGGNKAMLTLANGSTIILNEVQSGQLASQGNTKVIKVNGGVLAYQPDNQSIDTSEISYNALTVPKGGRYQLVLSDGTKVWLNAASSIRYPTTFAGRKRKVSITGEAYFEVAKNAEKPFEVLTNDMTISVLGTHFNVAAYADDPTSKVTLLEGAVKVKGRDNNVLLKPGEQASLDGKGRLKKVADVNTTGTVSWIHNQFWFNNADIETIMRQISRWYNVDVVIKGDIPEHFEGYISRDVSVSKIFEALQQTNLAHFTIEKDKIIVSP